MCACVCNASLAAIKCRNNRAVLGPQSQCGLWVFICRHTCGYLPLSKHTYTYVCMWLLLVPLHTLCIDRGAIDSCSYLYVASRIIYNVSVVAPRCTRELTCIWVVMLHALYLFMVYLFKVLKKYWMWIYLYMCVLLHVSPLDGT